MSYSKKTHRLQRSTRSAQRFPPPAAEPGDTEPRREDGPPNAPKPKLLDRVREEMRTRHMAKRTEKAYVSWIKRFIFFFDKRHPDTMGGAEISTFASYLANVRKVSASTQSQALSALLFLYRNVLGREIEEMEITRAKRGVKLPLVLSRDEVAAVLRQMEGTVALMALLMYGAGLRLTECCRLRVKDVSFDRREIMVRDGKGEKD